MRDEAKEMEEIKRVKFFGLNERDKERQIIARQIMSGSILFPVEQISQKARPYRLQDQPAI